MEAPVRPPRICARPAGQSLKHGWVLMAVSLTSTQRYCIFLPYDFTLEMEGFHNYMYVHRYDCVVEFYC